MKNNEFLIDVEQYRNIIELMKQALMFYADIENYNSSKIILDLGSQARFAIETVDNILKQIERMDEEYNKMISSEIDSEETQINIINTIKVLKNENTD